MSRIGFLPITIEDGVTAEYKDGVITVKGSMGEDSVEIPSYLDVKIEGDQIELVPKNDKGENELRVRAMHGTIRSLVYNAAVGVKNGYTKKLEIHGVGYRVKPEGKGISLSLGWNHPVVIEAPDRIEFEIPDETTIIIKGINKQEVGEIAARIRELRKPEPYKGKGIRYEGEYVRRKSAKVITETA